MPETQEQKDAIQATKDAQAVEKARQDAEKTNAAALAKAEAERDELRRQIAELQAKESEVLTGPAGYVTVDHTGKVVS